MSSPEAALPAEIAEALPSLIESLFKVDGVSSLTQWTQSFEHLTSEALRAAIQLISGDPFTREVVLALALLISARDDADFAWRTYQVARERMAEESLHLDSLVRAVISDWQSKNFKLLLPKLQDASTLAHATGNIQAFALLCFIKGDYFWSTLDGHRAQNLEFAIEAYLEGFQTAKATPNQSFTAEYAQRLAVAYGERLLGDQLEDLPKSEQILVELLGALPETERSLIAMTENNLAVVLLREVGEEPLIRLKRARVLCLQALRYRRLSLDPIDWAFSQLTLGDIEKSIATLENRSLIGALRAYKKVCGAAARIRSKHLVAAAYHRLARLRLELLNATSHGPGSQPQTRSKGIDTRNLLGDALAELDQALRTSDNPYLTALIQIDVSQAFKKAGRISESIEIGFAALSHIQPTVDPGNCQIISQSLGDTLALLGRWRESADMFLLSVDSCERLLRAKVNSLTREAEARRAGNVYRWAAFALARDGRTDRAIEVLELGRARELRDREPLSATELAKLSGLPHELLTRFDSANSELSAAPFGSAASAALRKYYLVLAEVRRQIGDRSFLPAWNIDAISAAATTSWPVIYIDPTPWGTVLLCVTKTGSRIGTAASFIDTTGFHVYLRTMLGPFDPSDTPDDAMAISYILNASEGGAELEGALDLLLPWLGEHICRHISSLAQIAQAAGITLIACGPIASSPIHAASWVIEGRTQSILDQLPVRYGPSASAVVSSLRRLETGEDSIRLLAMGNPESNNPATALPGAESEITAIVRKVGASRSRSALREAASAEFLISNSGWATHIHLACHGSAGLFDGVSRVYLSDRSLDLRGPELLPVVSARLTVLSACQTGVISNFDMWDEVLSMGTAFMSAGSACVIASLWEVDDAATALLFTKFYEQLSEDSQSPAFALRDAQLWLRYASRDQILEYLSDNPELSGLRLQQGENPYAHPVFWAAFVALGV